MKEYYTVGEIGKIFGVSIDTLRYYSKVGLIIPRHIGENNYRYYSIEQFESISTVLFLRSIGTPIEKIIDILHHKDMTLLQEELHQQEEALQEKISQLQQLKSKVESFHAISQGFRDKEIAVEYAPKLWVLSQEFPTNEIELNPNDIAPVQAGIDSKWMTTANIIATLSIPSLLNRDYHTYSRYGLISEFPCPSDSLYLSILPEGHYVCANAKIYQPNHSDVNQVYDRMLDYIKKHNLVITGEAFERHVLDLYVNEKNETVHFMKIYIPIKMKEV